MVSILSLVTSVKDYVEIIHKLIETDSNFKITNYSDLGPIITYTLITLKDFILNIINFNWLKTIWDLPVIIPDISSAMISEISVLDGYFHNAFNFLDNPISYGNTNLVISSLEKFSIGLINSLFLCIPTGTSHLITLRRFVMQGLEAGYLAGLGSICGNILWIGSIIFGCRFFVIPWLSLDIFRYLLGFVLLVKYMWDSYNEKKIDITTTNAKQKIFLLNFLLALTEQTSVFPFISNISIGSDSSLLESFPAQNYLEFFSIHGSYILGLVIGCLSLLHFTCWFWENPAFKIYMWVISSFKISTNFYYKALNFTFLYLTMICAISSIPYYGLDYTLTNPLGFVQDDRILDQKLILETSFLNTKASDRNTRRNRGRHGRRERWKRRIRKYRTFDASLYDQGIYDLFSIEDLNYGFDRFWLRRKMRNHRVRFRFFPGPWMRSFKKQLAKPRLESYAGPRQEFFRILFEQVYHPSFHQYNSPDNLGNIQNNKKTKSLSTLTASGLSTEKNRTANASTLSLNDRNPNLSLLPKKEYSAYYNGSTFNNSLVGNLGTKSSGRSESFQSLQSSQSGAGLPVSPLTASKIQFNSKENLKVENSTLRKFVRKINNRIKSSEIKYNLKNSTASKNQSTAYESLSKNSLYSKRWKQIFSKLSHDKEQLAGQQIEGQLKGLFKNFYQTSLNETEPSFNSLKKENSKINLSKHDKQILKYRSIFDSQPNDISGKVQGLSKLKNEDQTKTDKKNISLTLLHPLKFYLKKQEAFERKLRYYTPTVFRKFSIENNAPYFRVMMKRYFYYFKPTLRWERTMKVASLRKARRKTPASPRKIQFSESNLKNLTQNSLKTSNQPNAAAAVGGDISDSQFNLFKRNVQATHNYTIVGKRASRFRYEIYKDVLQHWYYSPFNRLLLKFDIDLFIKRQPNSHFLTKNEENLLHLRRFLLSEHYNTLRWYSYMQHYRSMKTKIGGTKSFSSKVYNQQFSGTFKKIRHLFAITPSQSNQSVLKFDQPLYNEIFNNSKNNLQKNLIIHEELLNNSNDFNFDNSSANGVQAPTDLLNQSTEIVGTYLKNANPIKQEYIKKLIDDKDYLKLTEFLYKGQKLRGLKPIINERNLLNQEKEYLLTDIEKDELKTLEKIKINKMLRPLQQDLWINLLKKWKRKINDQEFLKNYLQRRIEKREKRKNKKEKNLKIKLERLENWLSPSLDASNSLSSNKNKTLINTKKMQESATTGINNALIDGVLSIKNEDNSLKTQKIQQRLNFNEKLNWSTDLTDSQSQKENSTSTTSRLSLNNLKNKSFIKKEKELNNSIENLTKIIKQLDEQKSPFYLKLKNQISLKNISFKIKTIYNKYKYNSNQFIRTKLVNIFKPILPRKNNQGLKNWQQKERSLNKEKRSRKEFKAFSKKPFQGPTNNKNYLKYLTASQKSDLPLNLSDSPSVPLERKKRDFSTGNSPPEELSAKTQLTKSNWSGYSILKETYRKYFSKKFKRKKSPQRRARIRRNRGVTKKRTLSDSLKREFKNLRKYGSASSDPASRALTKMDDKKQKIFLSFNPAAETNRELNVEGIFKQSPLQRRSKQKKQRFWKQKRSKYSQKSRKYKKRRRSVLGKIRILNKQLKRVQSTTELKNWWWKNFLPNLRATTDSLLQLEKDRQIQQKLQELSIPEILERDQFNNFKKGDSPPEELGLQIGDFDFKPLSMPEAIKLRENILKEKNISLDKQSAGWSNNQKINELSTNNLKYSSIDSLSTDTIGTDKLSVATLLQSPKDIISKLSQTSLLERKNDIDKNLTPKQILSTNTVPFYAGWDESLRKFVVTNRLLSRRSSGYEMPRSVMGSTASQSEENQGLLNNNLLDKKINNIDSQSDFNKTWFTDAPLKGMNAATTLYWQIPFTTYDPDQFFALGMDGFAPLGWRRFQFRHSILKSWLYEKTVSQNAITSTYIIKNKTNILQPQNNCSSLGHSLKHEAKGNANNNSKFIYKLNQQLSGFSTSTYEKNKILNQQPGDSSLGICQNQMGSGEKAPLAVNNIFIDKKFTKISNKNGTIKNIYRRLKKRYKRVKKHPRSPVWFPSGPLLNQVLPVHYIYIFYKRSRLPRDRYIKRRLKKANPVESSGSQPTPITDFTLRKRVKTKRKYHIKKDLNKKYPLIPRRMKFIGNSNDDMMRWRPLSRQKINKPIAELIKEQRALKYKQRKKEAAARQGSNNKQTSNIRVKQLRRRVQRQIIRSVWRYRPRAGGFVWPGDYLKLEQIKAPKLSGLAVHLTNTNINKINNTETSTGSTSVKVKRKKKRNVQEWQIQPKKYLLEKHNSNAIKKKLEKANRSNKIRERIKDLNSIL